MKSRWMGRTQRTLAMAAAACLVVLPGCSAFRSSTQVVMINSNVPEADVYINGAFVGKTPVSTQVKRSKDFGVSVRKAGYVPAALTVESHLNVTGVLDIVGTLLFLVPVIGLFTSGAWSLDETQINVNLGPMGSETAPPPPSVPVVPVVPVVPAVPVEPVAP